MRIHTKTVWQMTDDGGLVLLHDESYEYTGPVAEARNKNKQRLEELSLGQAQRAKELEEQQRRLSSAYTPWLLSTIPKPGETSSEASRSILAQGLQALSNAYGGFEQLAEIVRRRSGRPLTPGGTITDVNALRRDQARAETALRTQEPLNRLNIGFQGLGAAQRQYALADPLGTSQAASQGFGRLAEMPSGFGKALGYATQLAKIGAAPFTGGASLAIPT